MKRYLFIFAALFVFNSVTHAADDAINSGAVTPAPGLTPAPDTPYTIGTEGDWVSRWMRKTTEIQNQQPRWIQPLITTTPLLEQDFRTNFVHETMAHGSSTMNYGGGKGLEIVPAAPYEVMLNVPPYIDHETGRAHDGFGDFSMMIKARMLADPEDDGDQIFSAYLGVELPTGQYKNGSAGSTFTPTVAAGKGFGALDVQSTFAISFSDLPNTGESLLWNGALQYRVFHYLWPQVEANLTSFFAGSHVGETQIFVTPGLMIGEFPIYQRIKAAFGAGEQIAVTSFHNYDHAWIVTGQLYF